ncbi:MAG: hypothetical protein H0Z34_00530 [Brevibacillus sp.]|nr:hypothetical protein [Brevibacillus sp.]
MNALHLADRLKEAENKIAHLRRAIDYISERQELTDSIDILNRIIKDYQVECDKMKKMLSQVNVAIHEQQAMDTERPLTH